MRSKRRSERKFYIKLRRMSRWRAFWWTVRHEMFWASQEWGLRDRLRCPICKKVGTWKPHTNPRRWLCKFCGYYEDPTRIGVAFPCGKQKVWMLKPLKRMQRPIERLGKLDPWRG